ncbi:hypothetical protein ACHAXT_004675 [Thalassiosira profunda]
MAKVCLWALVVAGAVLRPRAFSAPRNRKPPIFPRAAPVDPSDVDVCKHQTGQSAPSNAILGKPFSCQCQHGYPQAFSLDPMPPTQSSAVGAFKRKGVDRLNSGLLKLTCPLLVSAVDVLEDDGIMKEMNKLLVQENGDDGEYKMCFDEAHRVHAETRQQLVLLGEERGDAAIRTDTNGRGNLQTLRSQLGERGAAAFLNAGVAGANPSARTVDVKCLHAWLADYLFRAPDGENHPIGEAIVTELRRRGIDLAGTDTCCKVCSGQSSCATDGSISVQIPIPTNKQRKKRPQLNGSNASIIRRQMLQSMVVFTTTFRSIAAHADATLVHDAPRTSAKAAICDPTVESYRKGSNQIHIVGTAHISSVSASLSRAAVRETKPGAVFIELDLQRLSRAFRGGQVDQPVTLLFFTGENPEGGGSVTLQSAVLAPQNLERKGAMAKLLYKLTPKNPIADMYEQLEAQGITPGEEFVTAVEEGVNNGSLIVLGDRRMDITLKRLAKALIFDTDPKKLLEADRIISAKLKARIPEIEQLEEELKQQKRDVTKEELASFVESIKTKEATTEIMGEIKRAAPELHAALVGDRDRFMARGMDVIFSSRLDKVLPPLELYTPPPELQTMVSVVGLGHVAGVGNELQSLGWRKFVPSQYFFNADPSR